MISMQYQGQFSAQPCDTSNITSWILVGRVRYRFDTAFHVLYSRGQDISQAFNANVLQYSVRSCPVLASVRISVVRALLALFLPATLPPILLALVFLRSICGILEGSFTSTSFQPIQALGRESIPYTMPFFTNTSSLPPRPSA